MWVIGKVRWSSGGSAEAVLLRPVQCKAGDTYSVGQASEAQVAIVVAAIHGGKQVHVATAEGGIGTLVQAIQEDSGPPSIADLPDVPSATKLSELPTF